MQVEYGARPIVELGDERLEVALELVLGKLPRRAPRRRVRVTARDHLKALTELNGHVLTVNVQRRGGKHLAEPRLVVVTEHHVEADVTARQPLLGEAKPGGETVLHRSQEKLLHGVGVAVGGVELLLRRAVRIEAEVADALLDRIELIRAENAFPGYLSSDEAAVSADDRHDRLARDIAAHDEHVDAVERAGVDKLPPQPVGAVDIGGVVEREAQRTTSSGVSYQRLRRPTFARSRQRGLFGADFNLPARSAARASIRAAAPASTTSSPSRSRRRARLSATVV